MNPAPEWR